MNLQKDFTENTFIHAEDVAEDATDTTETAEVVMASMKVAAMVTVTADADVTDILRVDENGCCHIELEHGGFSEEISPWSHTFDRKG